MGLFPKLFEIQKLLKPIKRDATNPFFHSAYFDINSLLEAVKPHLTTVGLLISQPLSYKDGRAGIKTLVIDPETGEMLDEFFPFPELTDPQKIGACATYLRRFALQSVLALGAEDDDGNTASGKPKPVQKPPVVYRDVAVPLMTGGVEYDAVPFHSDPTPAEMDKIDKALGVQFTAAPAGCPKCGSELSPGKNGTPYCKPCYKLWANANK
jgi:hypothetical protein